LKKYLAKTGEKKKNVVPRENKGEWFGMMYLFNA
jgi:hypothetical protein